MNRNSSPQKSSFYQPKTKNIKTILNFQNLQHNLIEYTHFNQSQNLDLQQYDPFQSPPNFVKAQRHHKATTIGIPILKNDNTTTIQSSNDLQICQCCQNPINKSPIQLLCMGYPLYYKLAKYVALIILLIFFICGSAFYFINSINCNDDCLKFLGFNIINLQQQNQSSHALQIVNMITAIGIFGFVLYLKGYLNADIQELEKKIICPSQYTIMIQNLPKDFQEFQFSNWLSKTFQSDPVTINFGYNIQQLQIAYEKRNQATIQLRKLIINKKNIQSTPYIDEMAQAKQQEIEKQKQIIKNIERYDKIIMDYKKFNISYQKNGTGFITFQKIQKVQQILQKFQMGFFRKIFSNPFMSLIRRNKLQFRGSILIVTRAPAPRQVIWNNLEYSYFRNLAFEIFFLISMCILIYFGFKYQFKFSSYAYRLRTEGKQSGKALIIFQAVIMSLIVVLLNCLLRIIILIFTKLKKYHSYTAEQNSFCFYYTLMYVFNSCFMIYIVHGQYPEQSNQLLLYDIHFIMLANAFSQPLFKLFDPIMWHRILWKSYLKSLKPDQNPYTQMYINKWWEGHQISNGDNYQYLSRILFITVWFAHAAPLGVIFSFVGLFCDYWIGKAMLLKYYKKPENISKNIGMGIINCFQLLPLVYICGVLQFTYKVSTEKNVFEFLTNFFHYGIAVSILLICILGYLFVFKSETKHISDVGYSELKCYFGFNYDTQNPATRFKGQINFLNIKTQNVISYQNKQFLIQILKINSSPLMKLDKKRTQIQNNKIKASKKLTSLSFSIDEQEQMIEMSDFAKNNVKKSQFKPVSRVSSSSSEYSQKIKETQKKKIKIRKNPTLITD